MPASEAHGLKGPHFPTAPARPALSPVASDGNETDDLVILVHGTFASRDDDEGDNWWQNGSDAWRQIQQRLPRGVRMSRQGEVFHWSGENSERTRGKAGAELFNYLHALEARGQAYHLVGHSHGGSVIWNTLRLATIKKNPLTSLKSWATVGTPFLHHQTRGAWNIANLANILMAIVLLKPAYMLTSRLLHIIGLGLFGIDFMANTDAVGEAETISWWRTPVLQAMEWLGIQVETLEGGFRIGSYDSTSGESFFQYLMLTPEGWLMLGIALAIIYVYANLIVFLLMPVIESYRIRAEKQLERNVMETYRGRWLGLWSPDDEAINGLRATMDLSISFVSRMEPRERIWWSDKLTVLNRPYYWVLTPLFNWLLRPALDGWVRSFVIKTAQGNNRPAAEVIKVSPAPVAAAKDEEHPPIPDWLNKQIVDAADQQAGGIAPQLRSLLAEPSFMTGLERFGSTISGRELVHTSYFDHAAIIDLLAMHIRWARSAHDWATVAGLESDSLEQWFVGFKQSVGVAPGLTENEQDATRAATSPLIRPRRRVA